MLRGILSALQTLEATLWNMGLTKSTPGALGIWLWNPGLPWPVMDLIQLLVSVKTQGVDPAWNGPACFHCPVYVK